MKTSNKKHVCTNKKSIQDISANAHEFVIQMRTYLGTLSDEWTPIATKDELAAITAHAGKYYATYNKPGIAGKEAFVWLDIMYNGLSFSISTVFTDGDRETNNLHQYFGQINFINNTEHRSDTCPSNNSPETTVAEIIKRADIFTNFLNDKKKQRRTNHFKTIRQTGTKLPAFTVDNFLSDECSEVNAESVIALFEKWVATVAH